MKNKYVFVAVMLSCILLLSGALTTAYVNLNNEGGTRDKIKVVTSFYPMYIAAMNVVGDCDSIELSNLSEPQTGCLHDFTLTPEDMKLLSTADVFIINGAGIESFMEEVAGAYPKLSIVTASQDLELIEEDGEQNPHAWMSIDLYEQQVENIEAGLKEADPENSALYEANAKAYIEKLSGLKERQEALKEKLSKDNRIILFHCAYDYVAEDLGLEAVYELDLDEERHISAGEVAQVVEAIEGEGARFILAEELYGREMAETVMKETAVKTIYLDPLNKGDYNPDSYIEGMQRNLEAIEQAFSGKEQ